MFTKTKSDGAPGLTAAQDAVRGASSKSAARVGASIICSDMKITGSVQSDGALQIDGTIEGDVTAGDITIGSSGSVVGEVKSETLRVKGTINGAIRSKKVELETGARVEGDIIHAALIIQPDATFEGMVRREDDPLKTTAPKAADTPSVSDPVKETSTATPASSTPSMTSQTDTAGNA